MTLHAAPPVVIDMLTTLLRLVFSFWAIVDGLVVVTTSLVIDVGRCRYRWQKTEAS